MTRSQLLIFTALLTLTACGGRKPPPFDAGMEDSGTDAGPVDAGRLRGSDPDAGYTTAIELPDSNAPTLRVGVSASLALDQYGQPMIACINTDPNADGDPGDNQVIFTRWNGVKAKYETPVVLSTIGDVAVADPSQQVSLTRDPVTGTLYAAFVTQDKDVKVAYSTSEGATWSQEIASDNAALHVLSNPMIVARNDVVTVTYLEADARCTGAGCADLVWRTRTGTGAYSARAVMPVPAGYDGVALVPYQLAIDSTGSAGVAAAFEKTAGLDVAIAFFRTSQTASSVISTSMSTDNTMANGRPSVSLAFDASNLPRVAFHLLTPVAMTQLWYAQAASADGMVWGSPVPIPRNGAGGAFEGTQLYQSLAIDSAGKLAIGAHHDAVPVSQQCTGGPKIARSSDGSAWTVCRPDTGGAAGFFGEAGEWIHAAFHAPGKVTLGFTYENRSNPNVHAGYMLWRDR